MSKLLSSDTSYRDWIQEVSKRFRQSQIRAAVKVNDEMLRFYWSLGKDISRMSENAAYGTGFYKAISADLQDIFPDVHSFSVTNLKYMRYFYEMYPIPENRQQVVDDSGEVAIRQQTVDELSEDTIFRIPWGIMWPLSMPAATIRIKLYSMCGKLWKIIGQELCF